MILRLLTFYGGLIIEEYSSKDDKFILLTRHFKEMAHDSPLTIAIKEKPTQKWENL